MDEYIKKADVLEYLSARKNQVLKSPLSTLDAKFEVMEIFDFVTHRIESADVAPIRHGRWKRIGENYENCTHCGYIFEALPSQDFFEMNNKFCRMCGATMDLED